METSKKYKKDKIEVKNILKDDTFDQLYTKYELCDGLLQKDRKNIRSCNLQKQVIRELVDKKIYEREEDSEEEEQPYFHSYPSHNNPDFVYELSKKAEFFHYKLLADQKELNNRCNFTDSKFELGNHQLFLKNFIQEKTPYKGLLVFHGVGVGKTCSAISISQSFRDVYKRSTKKIICLVSKNIRPGWMNTIYDPEKGINQCTGDTYESIVRSLDSSGFLKQSGSKRKINKMIHQYYEFYGYREFSGMINRLVKTGKYKDMEETNPSYLSHKRNVINEYFSDRLLLIDEVHNLRDESITHSKETLRNIETLIKYSRNMRLIMLSATPMFNRSVEIVWLLNMLLHNDKRPPITEEEIFDDKQNITSEGKKLLFKKSRGYISYLRGENPITFPIRLYPDSNNDPQCITKYPSLDMWGDPIENYTLQFIKLYGSPFQGLQKVCYDQMVSSFDKTDKINISQQKIGVQVSNIVYPFKNVIDSDNQINVSKIKVSKMYGNKGLSKVMDVNVRNKQKVFSYRKDYLENVDIPMFDEEQIGFFSSKINSILQSIKKSKGIIFIYSEYLSSGIIPLAIALEHLGYGKYSQNLLDYPEYKPSATTHTKRQPIDYLGRTRSDMKKSKDEPFKQAKYIILTADSELSPNNENEVKKLVDHKNKNGENIKIVLGNVVASEGLDLKNIREVHILDPWFHLNRVEQIIGRGIRFCSHNKLETEDRNVTIYLHVGTLTKNKETIDIKTYRYAEEKAIQVGKVETILKRIAVDYYLNKPMNVIKDKDFSKIQLVSSRGTIIKDYSLEDKSYSKVCSFQEECDYNIYMRSKTKEKLMNLTTDDINYDTFSLHDSKDLIQKIQTMISQLFKEKLYYYLQEIVEIIMSLLDVHNHIIYYSLQKMIETKHKLWNSQGIIGYIVHMNDFYIFQPYDDENKMISLYYRSNIHSKEENSYISLNDPIPFSDDIIDETDDRQEIIAQETSILFKTLESIVSDTGSLQSFLINKKEYTIDPSILQISPKTKLYYYLDSLHIQDKITILYTILTKNEELNDIENDILLFFKTNLLYSDNIQQPKKFNVFIQGTINRDKIVGFFLHKDKIVKQRKDIMNQFDYFIIERGEGDESQLTILDETSMYQLPSNPRSLLLKKRIIETIESNLSSNNVFKNVSKVLLYPFKKDLSKILGVKLTNPTNKNGISIKDISNKENILEIIRKSYPEYLTSYQTHLKTITDKKEKVKLSSKIMICLLIEMIHREKQTQEKEINPKTIYYIPLDSYLLYYV